MQTQTYTCTHCSLLFQECVGGVRSTFDYVCPRCGSYVGPDTQGSGSDAVQSSEAGVERAEVEAMGHREQEHRAHRRA